MAFNYKRDYARYKNYYLKVREISKEPLAKTSFVLIASLLTISFFGIFAIKPTFATIAVLLKEIKDKKKVNQQLGDKVAALNKAQNTYTLLAPKLERINVAMPKSPDFPRLEREIEYLTYKHDLLLASGGFEGFVVTGEKLPEKDKKNRSEKESLQEDQDGTVETISFNLVLAGEYNDLKDFLKDLELLDRIILVDATTFSKETDIKGASLQMMVKAKAFYLKPPKV